MLSASSARRDGPEGRELGPSLTSSSSAAPGEMQTMSMTGSATDAAMLPAIFWVKISRAGIALCCAMCNVTSVTNSKLLVAHN